jgi:hypothetical protein
MSPLLKTFSVIGILLSLNAVTAEANPYLTPRFKKNRVNVALSSNGGVASASSNYNASLYPLATMINGDTAGTGWGASTGGWNSSGPAPCWAAITFSAPQTIDEIDVFTLQDNYTTPSTPTVAMTFTQWGITAFNVNYWNGSSWVTVPGGTVTGNNLVWRKFTFPPVTTNMIQIPISAALGAYCRITEIQAFTN